MKKLFIILMIILMPLVVLAQEKEPITVDPTDGFDVKEILQDIQNKTFVDSVNQVELKEVKADGGKWYLANVREVKDDNTAVYRNIHFYVVDEGLKTEIAYYKDSVPVEITQKAHTFTENVNKYTKDGVYQIDKTEEDLKYAIARKYEDDGAGNLIEKKVIITEVNDLITEKEVVQKETLSDTKED